MLICQWLHVVVPVGLVVSNEVSEARAKRAIMPFGLSVGLWILGCRFQML